MELRSLYHMFVPLLLLPVVLSSCIRDDIQPCPPLQVMLDVEDKNYNNIDFVEQHTGVEHRVDENMSFRSYIQKLFYALYDLETGEIVTVRHLHEVTGDAPMATVYLPEDLPFGRYGLMVWGNINSEEGILADGRLGTYDLHAGHVEGYDVYMAADELVYDELHYEYIVKLKRMKGKLIIQAEGFPDEIGWSQKVVSDVMGNVDYELNYSESENVVTERTWEETLPYVSYTNIAPSASDSGSKIEVQLYDSPDMEEAVMRLSPVTATFKRNEITVLRYVYDADTGTTDVFILLDDGWNEIVNLEK